MRRDVQIRRPLRWLRTPAGEELDDMFVAHPRQRAEQLVRQQYVVARDTSEMLSQQVADFRHGPMEYEFRPQLAEPDELLLQRADVRGCERNEARRDGLRRVDIALLEQRLRVTQQCSDLPRAELTVQNIGRP
jgi:hypothetical protein